MKTVRTESQIAIRSRGGRIALAIVSATLLMGTLATRRAEAQVFVTLRSFNGSDGSSPQAGLVRDTAGNLYGTTYFGGSTYCGNTSYGNFGCGTVFKLDPSGDLTVLHSFGDGTVANDGENPQAGLVLDSSGTYLYGTTSNGGSGYGTVFKLDTSGNNFATLYSFSGGSDGADPQAGLIFDSKGNLYGTTNGSTYGHGTVFKIDASGCFNVLHSFTDGDDGAYPSASLILNSSGTFLYGTTSNGGSGAGTVFTLDTSGNNFKVLYTFTGSDDGAYPEGGLVLDSSGNLYGTTSYGGSGYGTVFKLDTSGNLTVLHSFTGGDDGGNPAASLILNSSGIYLYGTTSNGGSYSYGTVFKLDTSGNLTVLHSFSGSDGANPYGGLILDFSDNLYGTTSNGGSSSNGTVFEIATTPQQGTQVIVNQVDSLYMQGVLKQGQDNSLDKELNQAISLMDNGKNNGAIQNLQDFIAETEDLESSGVLASPQAEPLTSQANTGASSPSAELLISEANAVIAELQ